MRKRVVIISIVLICIIVLACLSMPAIAVLGESLFVQLEIRNPYVNNHFSGWSCVQIEGFKSFLIPKEWSLDEEAGIYKIINDVDEVWAYGAVLGSDESCVNNYEDLITTVYNTPSVELEVDPFSQFLIMDGSDIDLLRVHGEISRVEFFCIQLFENTQKELVWILMPDLSLDEVQYDIAEAMVYSYAFEVN